MEKLIEVVEDSLELLRPPPTLSVSEWADAERYLSSESSSAPGKWNTANAPYQREIMDTAKDPDIQEIVFMSSSQVGKTEVLQNIIGYFSQHDPAPILLVQPTLNLAEAYSKDRLTPMIRDTPALLEVFGETKSRSSGQTLLHKKFPGGHITLAGSNSPASLASRPIRIALFDEVDRYSSSAGKEGDPVSLGKKRTTTFYNRLSILVSTPGIKKASRIERAWEGSDQRRYHVHCPHCRIPFAMRFSIAESSTDFWEGVKAFTLKWDPGKPEAAYFVCENCGGVIEHSLKHKLLEGGTWIKGKPAVKGIAGFHLNELYSPWKTWGEVALDFYEKKKSVETLKTFVNTSLGETWEIQGDAPEWKRLYDRRENYRANEIPAGVKFLTAAADVQKNRIEVEIVGWGENNESWSIDYRVFLVDVTQVNAFDPLNEILREKWRHPDGADISILRFAIDSGYQPQNVYKWAKKFARSKVMAVKGFDSLDQIFEIPKAPDKRTLRDKENVLLWKVGVSLVKREIYGWLKQEIPSDEDLAAGGYPYGFAHFPKDYDENYFKMLTAEVEDIKVIRGFPQPIWVKKHDRNEALDCRVYNRAAAASLGIDRVGGAGLEKLASKSRIAATADPTKKSGRQIVRKKSTFLG